MINRYYSFRIITYAKEEEFQELLKYGSKWEYIYHDKDIKEDGTKKEPHWHINIILRQWKSIKGVCELVKSEQNTMAIPMIDKQKAHRYLTHKDELEKYQYEDKLIKSSENKIWEETESKEDENERFLEIICSREISTKEKAIKIGKDYMKNYDKYERFVQIIKAEEDAIERGYPPGIKLIGKFELWNDYYNEVELPILRKIKDPILKKYFEQYMIKKSIDIDKEDKEQLSINENGAIKGTASENPFKKR